MRILASALLLSILTLGCISRAVAANSKPDPSQYTLAVHVSAAEYAPHDDIANQILTVTIGGKHCRLWGGTVSSKNRYALINPGDYPARLTVDEHKTSYESRQTYEFLFPDGTTRRFDVIAQSER
jgi:hypothetical protein